MSVGDYLEALQCLPFGTLRDLTAGQPFLVLSPHPDDETLGCGGLLAAAGKAGVPAHVVILTDGAASHPGSRRYPPARLTALRHDEARRAIACLGLPEDHLRFLDLPDAATPSAGADFDAAVDAIVRIARETEAATLFVTWGHDPHCDHETAYAMAGVATSILAAGRPGFRLWAYPVWGLHLPPDGAIDQQRPRGFRLDIAAEREAKLRAIQCYASQMTDLIDDDPDAFRFTPAQLLPFLSDREIYIEVD